MRIAIIVLIVAGVLLAIYFVAAGTGHVQTFAFQAPDTNNLDGWKPPKTLSDISDLASPLAPHAHFDHEVVTLGLDDTNTLEAADPKDPNAKMEIAKIAIVGPGAIDVRYACSTADLKQCPIDLCLCAAGSALTPLKLGNCPQPFRDANPGGVCAADSKPGGSMVIYRDARRMTVFNLGPQEVRATVK